MGGTTVSVFGSRLRAARTELGMSQAELGGSEYSASYISHLETGRRQPTVEMTRLLAERLHLRPEDLLDNAPGSSVDAPRDAALAELELRVHAAAASRDHNAVIAAADGPALPRSEESPYVWWGVTWLKAEAQLASEQYGPCAQTARDLAASPLANVSSELRAAALALCSRALRAGGRLDDSLERAGEAVEAATDSGEAANLATALREQVASLAELGRMHEAALAGEQLSALHPQLMDGQLLGLVCWTVGNIAFLRGDVDRGLREHAISAEALRPESDLRLWARFHKASAAMRLAAGVTEDVDLFMERAGHALALVGNASDLAELDLLRAERIVDSAPDQALELVAQGLTRAALPQHTQAEGMVLKSRALESLGRPNDARSALILAAHMFDHVGADKRSAEIWRRLAGGDSGTTQQLPSIIQ